MFTPTRPAASIVLLLSKFASLIQHLWPPNLRRMFICLFLHISKIWSGVWIYITCIAIVIYSPFSTTPVTRQPSSILHPPTLFSKQTLLHPFHPEFYLFDVIWLLLYYSVKRNSRCQDLFKISSLTLISMLGEIYFHITMCIQKYEDTHKIGSYNVN